MDVLSRRCLDGVKRGSHIAMFWRDFSGDDAAEKKRKKLFALWGEFERLWNEICDSVSDESSEYSFSSSSSDSDEEEELFFPLSFFVGDLVS